MGTGFSGNGWGWISSSRGWMGMGINCRPRAALYKEGVGKALSACRSCDAKRSELPLIFTPAQCQMRNEQEQQRRLEQQDQ